MHATGADAAAGATGHGEERGCQRLDIEDGLGVRLRARVGRIEAVDVGGDEQRIGIDQRRDHGGEIVVVAQLQFVHRNGVVLVDHRQRAQRQQFLQGGPRIEVTAAVPQIVVGQQHLRDRPFEETLPQANQLRLSERGQRLPFGHRDAAGRLAVQQSAPRRDRTGGHDDHFAPGLQAGGYELGQVERVSRTQPFPVGGQQAAADLEHGAFPRRQDLFGEGRSGLAHGGLSGYSIHAR